MEDNIKWTNLKNTQKNNLFNKYIENELEKNEKKYENGIIDNLTYTKNKFFLQTLKKDKTKYKNCENDNIIIKNNTIEKINNIKINDDGLIYFFNNKFKQSKITDYNHRKKNNNNLTIKNKSDNYKTDDNGDPVFLIP